MKRREFITLLGGMTVAWPLAGHAQEATRIWRIGILEIIASGSNAENFNAFRQGLKELGYVEGQNLIIEYRSADGDNKRFPDLAAELVLLKVDLIVTRKTVAALAAKKATETIPIVMAACGDPLGFGLVASLARPGGNITGLSSVTGELTGKRVELLKDMIPTITRISAVYNMTNPIHVFEWSETEKAAGSLKIQPRLLDVRKSEDIELAFNTARDQHADAMIIGGDTLTQTNQALIVELAASHQLPAIYVWREFVDAGGLFFYGPSYPDLYRRAATYADKVLKGAKPADLPIQQPTKFEMVINLKTAKMLGLKVPPSLLDRADEVIE
jgi:putative tryptophan/tyrosine transport system substrate-binding protein